MLRIGLLSDTHGYLDPRVFDHFASCHEIWHAGDFGSIELSSKLEAYRKLRAVYGNIDGHELRKIHPLHQKFQVENLNVWMTHIGGYPGHYVPEVNREMNSTKCNLFISGHSHILRVMRDKSRNNMVHINPGAAGKEGFHKVRTIVRFEVEGNKIQNLEVIELGPRAEIVEQN